MTDVHDFSDICPYDDSVFHEKMSALVKEPMFQHAISYVMPKEAIPGLIDDLLKIDNKYDFQHLIMYPFLEMLAKKTTSGITIGGTKYYNSALNYVFITNHRDIVLDASFMNLAFLRRGMPTTEIAIGNNLLVFDWIADLVRLNKSFIVKRNTGIREALLAAKQLSGYIHHAILDKKQSVWIAQREGRAKDSSDHTQDALIKMLSLGGQTGVFMDNLKEVNLLPVSISYEYDPCDYLKAREMQLKRDNPKWKKSRKDDLISMQVGINGQKGRIVYRLTPSINHEIDQALAAHPELRDLSRNEQILFVCQLIDQHIHAAYEIYPRGTEFDEYIESRLQLIHLSQKDTDFLRARLYEMYNYPVLNHEKAVNLPK